VRQVTSSPILVGGREKKVIRTHRPATEKELCANRQIGRQARRHNLTNLTNLPACPRKTVGKSHLQISRPLSPMSHPLSPQAASTVSTATSPPPKTIAPASRQDSILDSLPSQPCSALIARAGRCGAVVSLQEWLLLALGRPPARTRWRWACGVCQCECGMWWCCAQSIAGCRHQCPGGVHGPTSLHSVLAGSGGARTQEPPARALFAAGGGCMGFGL